MPLKFILPRISIFFIVVLFALTSSFSLHASESISGPALDKARTQLTAKLEKRGYPELAGYFKRIDIKEWATIAGRLSGDSPVVEAEAIFRELLNKNKEAVISDLYIKAKGGLVSRGIIKGDTRKYLEFVEDNFNELSALAEHAYNGNFRGAGDILVQRMKQEIQVRAKEVTSGYVADTLNYFLQKSAGGLNVGSIYLKLIEWEITAIGDFEKYTTDYFGKFTSTRDGEEVTYNWCSLYSEIRRQGNSAHEAFHQSFSSTGNLPAINNFFFTGGLHERGGISGGNWYSTGRRVNGAVIKPDKQTFWRELELCFIRSKVANKAAANSIIDDARKYADKTLFEEIKKGMVKPKEELIRIFVDTKIKVDFELIITVADEDSGKIINDATIQFDGNMQKAPNGTASFPKKSGTFKGDTRLRMEAEAPGYEKKTIREKVSDLKKKINPRTNQIPVRIKLKKKSGKFDLKVLVLDKYNKMVTNATVKVTALLSVKSKKAVKTNVPMFGYVTMASFKLKSDLLISPDSPFFKVVISAEAPGYEANSMEVMPSKLKSAYSIKSKYALISILLKKKEGIDRLEITCDQKEIFEDESAHCKALIHFPSGKTKDISQKSTWTPPHVETLKGTVEGKTVKQSHTLPHTVAISAKYIAPPEDGGKTWKASNSVLVKPRPGISKPKIALRKSSSSSMVNKGDVVTYTYTVSNPGKTSLEKINIRDDKCSPLTGKRGDTNKNNRLDPGEHWLYECSQTLNKDTVNTATVEGQDSSGRKSSASATATVKIKNPAVGDCPPDKVRVPYVIHKTETKAVKDLKKARLVGKIKDKTYTPYYKADEIMDQRPYAGNCVNPGTVVEMVASLGPKPYETPVTALSAKLECGSSFEIAPGDFPGKSCDVVVRGWND